MGVCVCLCVCVCGCVGGGGEGGRRGGEGKRKKHDITRHMVKWDPLGNIHPHI